MLAAISRDSQGEMEPFAVLRHCTVCVNLVYEGLTFLGCFIRSHLWFAKIRSRLSSKSSALGWYSVGLESQGVVAKINQHRMVLEVEPPAEDLEATILRPSRSIVEPPR
jgi:hypothetical protein